MLDTFIHEAKQASERAKRDNASLLLLIFHHRPLNFQLLLNDED